VQRSNVTRSLIYSIALITFRLIGLPRASAPEASGPIRQIVLSLLLGVAQPVQHPGSGFPGNSAVSIEVPHSVTGCFVSAENFGDQLSSGAVAVLIFYVVVFDIDPEPKNSRHPEFHWLACRRKIAARRRSEISVPTTRNSTYARAQLQDGFFRNNRSSFRPSRT
jgi:hypothetical protein